MKRFGSFPCLVFFACLCVSRVVAQTPTPIMFFSDLTSGPNSGGESVSGFSGAYVTLYGNFFGTSPTVTWNGLNCLRVVPVSGNQVNTWMWYQKVVVQFGSGCTAGTGAFAFTVNGQTSSCADIGNRGHNCQFDVQPGSIHFVSTTGNDNNNGSFASPWATLLKARDTMAPGDITYAENGTAQITDDGRGWSTCFSLDGQQGAAGSPLALVAYPGATVTIGSVTNCPSGIRSLGGSGAGQSHWVFAGLTLTGGSEAVAPYQDTDWRVIGNGMTCPNGNGPDACFIPIYFTNSVMFGTNLNIAGIVRASAEYHGVYYAANSNHNEIGWNTIANVRGCRGIQLHSAPQGSIAAGNLFDIQIHDNVVHDTQCDGMVLDTIDPSQGAVSVYNNVVYNAGLGNTPEGTGDWACVYVPGYTESGTAGGGNVEVYNNTFYNCGPNPNPPYGGANGGVINGGTNSNLNIHIRNNIIFQVNSAAPYWSNASGIFGSNNLMFGIGAPPANAQITGTTNVNPLLINAAAFNFHLSAANSPANAAGASTTPLPSYDHDGLFRPSPVSIGAYEFAASISSGPNPPTGLTATVH